MKKKGYDETFGKRIEKFSFFYPLSQIWKINPIIRKVVSILGILSILGVIFIVYVRFGNKLVNENESITFIFSIAIVLVLLGPVFIIFMLFDKCKFNAGIYSKGIEIDLGGGLYSELKGVKVFQYSENGNEYIKLIYTKYDDRITTEDILYNPKMDTFLSKLQETLESKEINCERITDIKNIEIYEPIEYKSHFWFFNVWRLLSQGERIHRIKNVMIFVVLYLFFGGFVFISSLFEDASFSEAIQQLPENFYSGLKFFLILLVILMVFLTIHFISSVKKFYARKENNAVYIHNGYGGKGAFLSDNYVLSKIKVNYGFIVEGNIEGIMLTVDNGKEKIIYKWPRNEEVERFCNDLLNEIRKRKKI